MEIAKSISALSTCNRRQVGAVIIRDGRCISWGFNGVAPGEPHCNHVDDEPCANAVHAESNAIAFAARQGISTESAELFVTVSPCSTCARLVIAAGICRVTYHEPYRDSSGVELLERLGVGVDQI